MTKGPKTYTGEKTASATMVLGKLAIHMQKTETRPLSLALYKNQV
jgi:hypothetical protein